MKIGVLSSYSNPLLPLLLRNLKKFRIKNLFVVLDKKDFSKNQKKLWKIRTGRDFLANLSIYDYSGSSIPFYFVDSHNSSDCIKMLKKIRPSVLINGGTPRKLSPEIINLPINGVINVHPGVLPKYRGADSVEWSIYYKDPVANSAHLMTDNYDEGPIIKKELVKISAKDSYQTIRQKTYIAWSLLMCKSILLVLGKKFNVKEKDYTQSKHIFCPMPKRKRKIMLNSLKSKSYFKKLLNKKLIY